MRIVVVSNRLPIKISAAKKIEPIRSAGGLVSALATYLNSEGIKKGFSDGYIWAGWPAANVPVQKQSELRKKSLNEFNIFPIFIEDKLADDFYSGFCNRTIWPLFHYFTDITHYSREHWDIYKVVNNLFAEQIVDLIRDNDFVWIHDYHLMLLPAYLRRLKPNISIGFFLHIPFPTYEIFRLLPREWTQELLTGVLGADLIGFHTYDYTQYFLRCVLRILGMEHNLGTLYFDNRVIKVDTFPIGVDFDRFNNAILYGKTMGYYEQIKNNIQKKIVLSVDRLDYTKGIINRLHAFDRFLELNPHWCEKVVLYIVVVPSRTGVEHYHNMKRKIDEYVGKINGKYGKPDWVPIIYQYKYLETEIISALYMASDVVLITPIRDGMNLVAKEYIASKRDSKGVVILSEMAGASQELSEAIVVNPNNIDDIANSIKMALEMPIEEQMRRMSNMRRRVESYNVYRWGDEILNSLALLNEMKKNIDSTIIITNISNILHDFGVSKDRIIFLDYDGTLVPFAKDPMGIAPDKELRDILRRLSEISKLFIVSGRPRSVLDDWFGDLNIGLVAEHGGVLKDNGKWIPKFNQPVEFKKQILPVFDMFTDRLPGSFTEEKESSICFHYRASDPELAAIRANELMDYLVNITANINVQIIRGDKVIECRLSGVDKGAAIKEIIDKKNYSFMLAIGDDVTDEDMFNALPEFAYTIKVGLAKSSARYRLYNYRDVRTLLEKLL